MAAQHENDSAILVNDSAIISLIKQLLADEPSEEEVQPDKSLYLSDSAVDDPRQEAGCLLWDMSATLQHAIVMAVSVGSDDALLKCIQLLTGE